MSPVATTSEQHTLTIDELARETGMTTRNIRAHQSRGLLPPPQVRARTGFYGPEHVARIRLIGEMQADGFNLKAIQRLLEASDGASEDVLGFRRALLSAFAEDEPEFATAEELEARFGGVLDGKVLRKAEKLGLVRPLGEGRYEIPSPTLLRGGEELVALGVPANHVLAVAEQVSRHTDAIARAFVRLFTEDVLKGGPATGATATGEWQRRRDALDRLTPLATEAVNAAFRQTMSRAVERQLREFLLSPAE
jgi:DNA-binding transcriptional MerR regulator